MKIKFNLEGSDTGAAFFALYAGLRMYMEQRMASTPDGQASIAAMESYVMLEKLRKKHNEMYLAAEKEYNEVYGGGSLTAKPDFVNTLQSLHQDLEKLKEDKDVLPLVKIGLGWAIEHIEFLINLELTAGQQQVNNKTQNHAPQLTNNLLRRNSPNAQSTTQEDI